LMRSWMDRPVCPMYTLPHSQGILYMPGVLNPGASFVGGIHIFLGGMATLLILYLANIQLSLPNVVCEVAYCIRYIALLRLGKW